MDADLITSATIARLNNCADFEGLRDRGRLTLPSPFGGMIEFDLAKPYRDPTTLVEEYWRFHPRYQFFKTVPEMARVIDIGAGSGGLVRWRVWGSPAREDVMTYAVDLTRGELFDQYVDFDLVDLSVDETKFPDAVFDNVILSHVITQIANRKFLAREVSRISKHGAKVYIEWPMVETGSLMTRDVLEPFGIFCSALNFFDDQANIGLISAGEASSEFGDAGFHLVSSGVVSNDFLAPELFRCGFAESNKETTTYGLWLALRFSQYLVMEKTA